MYKTGDIIRVPHIENYPYDDLPPWLEFKHIVNEGNEYSGFVSVLEVVESPRTFWSEELKRMVTIPED